MEDSTNSMVMPVAPMYGAGYGNGGFGSGFGGDWAWIILLLVLCGGWGNGFGGGYGGGAVPFMMGADMGGGFGLYPWMTTNQTVNGGFRDQMIHDAITSVGDKVSSGFGDVALGIAGINQNLCQTGNGIVSAVTAAQTGISQQLYSNELASLNRSFAEQTANTAGFTGVNSGLADLKYTVAKEACADRSAISDALKDVIAANTASTQRILDQLCADKLEAKNDEIANLRQQLNMSQLAASQTAQNAFISQGFANEVDALYNRLNSCPVPTTPVYGRTPIFTCNGNGPVGCGCGGNGFVN